MSLFDKYAKKYDVWYDKNKFAYLSEVEAVKRLMPEKGRGLEIGAGTGRFASVLGIEFGIDPSLEMLSLAEKRGIKAYLGFGENLPFQDNSFDYAVIISVLCFVRSPQKVLAESARILKKRGKLIIGIIDRNSFLGKSYKEKKSVFYKDVKFFNVRQLEDLIRAAGFSRLFYWQTLSDFPENLISVEIPQKGAGRGGFVVVGAEKS